MKNEKKNLPQNWTPWLGSLWCSDQIMIVNSEFSTFENPKPHFYTKLKFFEQKLGWVKSKNCQLLQLIPIGFYKAADILRDAINETVNPCDDFYEFSCGKWISTHEIPDDTTSYGRYSELQEKIYMEMRS